MPSTSTTPTDDELRARYGPEVRISRSRGFALVHLDRPDPDEIRERIRTFDPDDYFEPDCPLCAVQRSRRIVVFDDVPDPEDAEEEIFLD